MVGQQGQPGQPQMYPIMPSPSRGGGGQPQTGGFQPLGQGGQMHPGLLQMMMQGGGGGYGGGGYGGGGDPFSRIWGGAGQRGFGAGGNPMMAAYRQANPNSIGALNSLPPGLLQMMMDRQGQGQQYDPNWGNTQARRTGSPADYLQRGNDWVQGGIDSANAGLRGLWSGVPS